MGNEIAKTDTLILADAPLDAEARANVRRAGLEDSAGSHITFEPNKPEWHDRNGDKIDGAEYVVEMPTIMAGKRKWQDKLLVVNDFGFVTEGASAPRKDELPDRDRSTWPRDENGIQRDQWQSGYLVRLIDANGDIVGWACMGPEARQTVGDLLVKWERRLGRGWPRVVLDRGGYKNKDFGWRNTPKLTIKGWVNSDGTPLIEAPAVDPAQRKFLMTQTPGPKPVVTSGPAVPFDDSDIPFIYEWR